ncbi:MAG: NIPSNAP family protein [Firmicutes bacterium HGW-Firmicutes-7]|nr:MAG: NIPSNAP family protein [Firmicutes bacterium HGW-Firmicutes-7]
MIYELRIYYMYPNRMEAIHKRFSNHTVALFLKHDLKIIDFWEDAEGKNKIYYVIEHKDMEARNINFKTFVNDPEWIEVRDLSELDGPIVEKIESSFMNRVPYSPNNKGL